MLRILTLAAVGSLPLCAGAQTLVRTVSGPGANYNFGKACIVIADQNADGFDDLLVGAPGFSSQRGAVYCVSGAYLASGTGTQTLWALAPTANPGDLFGFAVADIGDATGDGIGDYLIGQPGYDLGAASDVGAVRLLDGSSHVLALTVGAASSVDPGAGARFGSAFAACGDTTGDGISEVVIGAPGSTSSYLRVVSGASLSTSGSSLAGAIVTWFGAGGNSALGTAIVSGFDLDGNGFQEFAVSSPGFDGAAGADTGAIDIREASPTFPPVGYCVSTIPGERFGQTLDAAHDYDGDGIVDIVVGAPYWHDSFGGEAGRVLVLSGARLANQTPPYEIYTFGGGGGFGHDFHFGAAVRACGDLNGDGVGEILVGTPQYFPITPLNVKGGVTVYSGATGTSWCSITGASNEQLGDALAGAIGDLDGDGFEEFVVAGSLADANGTDSGVVKCYRLFPVPSAWYCTGKTNSLGCTPAIGLSGSASATQATPFLITCTSVINQKSGLLMYSHAPNAAAFQGGTLCVKSPIRRTASQDSGGSASGSDCTGVFSFDFNARIQSGVDPMLVVGAELFGQYWSRDPAIASTTSLSNGLRFLINP
jgi:hypothetical protein